MKKNISMLLAVTILISCFGQLYSVKSYAFSEYNNVLQTDTACDKYTINFELPAEKLIENYSQAELQTYEDTVVLSHNAIAAENAKEFVQSLNLPQHGLEFIYESCISELDDISQATDYILKSYTVRVPKNSLYQGEAAIAQDTVPFEDLTYYGSYGGRDFYYYYYSESAHSTEYKRVSSRLGQWFSNMVDLILCFADANITVPVTLLKQTMGAPSGYTPNSQAYAEFYFNVNIMSRGIYTKYTTLLPTPHTTYDQVTSGQIGHLYPFVVFHPVDSPTYNGTYNLELGYQGPVYTPNFSNKDVQLEEAWMAFNGSIGNWHKKVMNYQSSYYWG